MNTTKSSRPKLLLKVRKAFSLIELLVVIAVIGIIAAIAIPNIANLTGGATIAKNQRNAQNLSSVFSAARAAGNTNTYADAAAAVTALTTSPGLSGVGSSSNATFYVPNMGGPDQTAALDYLAYSNSQLIYNSAGPAPSATP